MHIRLLLERCAESDSQGEYLLIHVGLDLGLETDSLGEAELLRRDGPAKLDKGKLDEPETSLASTTRAWDVQYAMMTACPSGHRNQMGTCRLERTRRRADRTPKPETRNPNPCGSPAVSPSSLSIPFFPRLGRGAGIAGVVVK